MTRENKDIREIVFQKILDFAFIMVFMLYWSYLKLTGRSLFTSFEYTCGWGEGRANEQRFGLINVETMLVNNQRLKQSLSVSSSGVHTNSTI